MSKELLFSEQARSSILRTTGFNCILTIPSPSGCCLRSANILRYWSTSGWYFVLSFFPLKNTSTTALLIFTKRDYEVKVDRGLFA